MLNNDQPIHELEAAALLRPFLDSGGRKIAVAVSGGADSMVLLALLVGVTDKRNILALTVDHGLRSGSAAEAAAVATWCAGEGIEHKILPWEGDKPESGIQAAARHARYHLLVRACEDADVPALMTAHNADDLAETVFARLARGSGPAGLAAMSPEIRIAAGAGRPAALRRPFLKVPGQRLRATAIARDLPFIDDPSNDDHAFERVRRRAFLAAIEAQGLLEKYQLMALASRMAEVVAAEESVLVEDFQRTGGVITGTGAVTLHRHALSSLPPSRRTSLLSRLIEAVSGSIYPPEREAVAAIAIATATGSATLAGALLYFQPETITILREPASLLGRADGGGGAAPLAIEAGEGRLWDHRMIVKAPADLGCPAVLEPLGRGNSGPKLAWLLASTMPVLRQNGEIIAVPHYAKKILPPAVVPWKRVASTLDIKLLTDERVKRQVIRF